MKRNVETPTSRPVVRAGEPQGDLLAERDRMLEEANAGCNEPDTGVVPGPKGSRRPAGAPTRENMENRLGEGRRRTAVKAAGAPSTLKWSAVDWRRVHKEVWRLQVRIAEAVRQGRWGKVRSLQRLLVRSRAAKLWAVRRVTTKKGKRTPGVDGVIWRGARQKLAAVEALKRRGYRPQPLRRVYIPKKNQKLRPLSIPTMKDRAMQALYLLALSPIAETSADPNSYGFRLRRSVADAWAQCFTALAKGYAPELVFEGDIESCFDRFSHPWLLENIPMDREVLRKWLEAGYLENATFYQTLAGTPQGGVISPVIANLALDGLERAAREAAPRVNRETRPKVHVIRYADDFIITAASKELLVERVIPAVKEFLAQRGLRLSSEKSRITQVSDGFEFLGADIRKSGRKLMMRPAKRNFVGFLRGLRDFLRKHRGAATWKVIQELNRRIRGWVNFYRCLVSSRVFRKLDSALFRSLWRWACARHPSKRSNWLRAKYFRQVGKRGWVFSAKAPRADRQLALFPELVGSYLTLFQASSVTIRRHVKVRADANPFDPSHDAYFRGRRRTPRTVVLGAIA
jgi:RNA-directed DNA polymerase